MNTKFIEWIGIIAIAVGAVSAYAVNDQQITINTDDIEKLQDNDEQRIRMEERQIRIQQDLKDIKQLIREATK